MSDSKAVRGARGGKRRQAHQLPMFYRQVVAELRKVVYPTQEQLITYFIVVMVFVIFMMAFVSVARPGLRQARLRDLRGRLVSLIPRRIDHSSTQRDGAGRV